MAGSRPFCPRCGETIPDGAGMVPADTRGSRQATICRACFVADLELIELPTTLTVRVCTQCGAVRRGERWVDVDAADYTELAIDAVAKTIGVHRQATDVDWSVEPVHRGPNEIEMHVHMTATVQGLSVAERHVVDVRINRETCTRCGRIAGDYYAGTVQVRATGRTPTNEETEHAIEIAHEVVAEFEETGDRTAFVSEITERTEGVDIRVSTNKIGAKIATRLTETFGGSYETAETLVTEDEDGEGVYRVAFAVRLPQYRRGELIDPQDDAGPVIVRSGDDGVRGYRLATGDAVDLSGETVEDAVRLGSTADLEETTVVAVEDAHSVQVLDPETFEAVTVARPAAWTPGDTAHVVKRDGAVYVVPDEVIPS